MRFKTKNTLPNYLAETTQYVSDLRHITALRDRCTDLNERESYNNVIRCMQEVLAFMNQLSKKDRAKIETNQEPVTSA